MIVDLDKYNVSNEAIRIQYNSIFRLELTAVIEQLLQLPKIDDGVLFKSRISNIIKEHTRLNVAVKYLTGDNGAAITVPSISKSNPLINNVRQGPWQERNALVAIEKSNGISLGSFNAKTGKVEGLFTELNTVMYIGDRLLFKGSKFEAAEIVAIMLHEIGHIVSYVELLTRTTRTNYLIRATVEAILDATDNEHRMAVLHKVEDATGWEFNDKKELVKSNDKETYQAIILSKAAAASVSELGSNLFDMRGFEAMADQYAARHGAAIHLATGLDKVYRGMRSTAYLTRPLFYMLEVVKITLFLSVAVSGIGGILIAPLLLLGNPNAVEYDKPLSRLSRIRSQLVETVKDTTLSDETRKAVLADITALNTVMSAMGESETFYEFLWSRVLPVVGKSGKEIDFQRDLEKLLNNELFVTAAAVKSLEVV